MDQSLILVISEVRGDTRRYRSLHLIEQLQLAGAPCRFVHAADLHGINFQAQTYRMVVFQRVACPPYFERMTDKMLAAGTVILSDFDDLIFDPSMFQFINSPDFVDPVRRDLYKQKMVNIEKMLVRSEACLASTEFLAGRIRQTGKSTWVHRNAFSLEMLAHAEKARASKTQLVDGVVTLGYASGTPTHNKDFELIKPVIMNVMSSYPQVRLRLVGPLDPGEGWGELEGRIQSSPHVPWRKLPEILAGFDVNLAPLDMNPFAQSKSEIKWMEAGMAEVPTIASPTEAFRYAIRHGENGWLAETADDWQEGLSMLVEDAALRKRLASQAYLDILREYHPVKRAEQLAEILEEISVNLRKLTLFTNGLPTAEAIYQRAEAKKSDPVWMPAHYEREPSQIKLGMYELRTWGIRKLILSAWVYFRRLVSPIFPFHQA